MKELKIDRKIELWAVMRLMYLFDNLIIRKKKISSGNKFRKDLNMVKKKKVVKEVEDVKVLNSSKKLEVFETMLEREKDGD